MKLLFPVPAQTLLGYSPQDSEDICAGKRSFPPSQAPGLFAQLGIPLSQEFPAPQALRLVFAVSDQEMIYGFNTTLKSEPLFPIDQSLRFIYSAQVLIDYVETLPAPQHLKLQIPYYGRMALQNLPSWKALGWKRKQGPLSHRNFWMRWDSCMGQHLVELL